MGLRITTWNVNGIRNPFGYQPWRDKRSFAAMFDVLEADIVVFQETKIQRKDLVDDMVLVPGWDCYFSLPRHKKGYSGVVIYTRQSVCAPMRAEEGITGILCPPSSSTSFADLPEDQQIGGYPTPAQLSDYTVDATTLDSEGRCVILEFPAFVLLGVYSPANRDETRDDFRLSFVHALDARIRNLHKMGKRVFLTGDLNISREELDSANVEASMRKQGLSEVEYVSTPARRLFNQLLDGGKVFGERDEGRERPVLWDICRGFHPGRKGMFTCWEQKVNARPGNCGARIDYVLSSLAMKTWFSDSNIQEGLMGSDHCPVYAVLKDNVTVDGLEQHIHDVMNLPGMFIGGKRQREYSTSTDPLPLSGRLIPEFSGRRNILDMFARKPTLAYSPSTDAVSAQTEEFKANMATEPRSSDTQPLSPKPTVPTPQSPLVPAPTASPSVAGKKRTKSEAAGVKPPKRAKSSSTPAPHAKGQQSLKGFFKPKNPSSAASTDGAGDEDRPIQPSANINASDSSVVSAAELMETALQQSQDLPSFESITTSTTPQPSLALHSQNPFLSSPTTPSVATPATTEDSVHDPIESKESWTKLFTKPAPPRCEGHNEPCISLLTKKPGMNLGRSFWMCSRPLGPTGAKEKGTQWRCQTFIWCSDWNSNAANGG